MMAPARDGVAEKANRFLNLLFRSSEAIVGGSPCRWTPSELDAFWIGSIAFLPSRRASCTPSR